MVISLALALPLHTNAKLCSAAEAEAADAIVDGLDSWNKIQNAVHRFGHCDDGGIAEGFSEAIARMLVDHWSDLPRLARLVQADPKFALFVTKHIDATLMPSDLERIASLATSACPQKLDALCQSIYKGATKALSKK